MAFGAEREQTLEPLAVFLGVEILKGPHPDVARGHAGQHGPGQNFVAVNGFARRANGERPRRGNADPMHELAHEVFPQDGADRGEPVARARVGRGPGPLELKVVELAVSRPELAEQNGTPVAKTGNEMRELMTRVGLRDRIGALGQAVPRKDLGPFRVVRSFDPQEIRQRLVPMDEPRTTHLARQRLRIEGFGQTSVGILEASFHGSRQPTPFSRDPPQKLDTMGLRGRGVHGILDKAYVSRRDGARSPFQRP